MDTTPPVVSITAPDAICYKSGALPSLVYTVDDANSYVDVVTGWFMTEGTHTVTVTATDALGYVGSASVTYTVDDTAPVVTITAPEDGAFYLVGTVPAGDYGVVEVNPYTVEATGWSNDGGEHTYTVTATDCAGNVGDASVTYYVIDNKYATIGGQIEEGTGKKKDRLRISFGGWVGLYDDTKAGEVEVTFHNVNNDDLNKLKFVSTSITSITFPDDATSTDPAAPPPTDKNKVKFWATGDLWDGDTLVEPNCQLIVRANDCGEPAQENQVDNIRIELNCADTTYNYDTHDGDWTESIDYRTPIDAGNIQVVYVVE